jgi:hypothetical protein
LAALAEQVTLSLQAYGEGYMQLQTHPTIVRAVAENNSFGPLGSKLNVVIFDPDRTSSAVLKAVLESKKGSINEVALANASDEAWGYFRDSKFNTIFIDVFSLGPNIGVNFIVKLRAEYPIVQICLYSSSNALAKMPGINDYWRNRFRHYFKLPKDLTPEEFALSIDDTLYILDAAFETSAARDKLRTLRNGLKSCLSSENAQELDEAIGTAEKVLGREKDRSVFAIVPGLNIKHMEEVVEGTLLEARQSIQITRRVNIGVLLLGSILVALSFLVASITNRWEAVAFGGFGMAGMIVSLITNPLVSISSSAGRLVQIQTAYFQFLTQLNMLSRDVGPVTMLERSDALCRVARETIAMLNVSK